METEIAIMKYEDETENENFQQCAIEEIIDLSESPVSNPVGFTAFECSENVIIENQLADNDVVYVSSIQDEPIDLTFDKPPIFVEEANIQNIAPITHKTPTRIIITPVQFNGSQNCGNPSATGVKRKMVPSSSTQEATNVAAWSQLPQPYLMPNMFSTSQNSSHSVNTPSSDITNQLTARQQEVLRMAKSMFSKRTRTLYQWMYPTASKHQIKQVVSNTWEAMGAQEKNIYISQVLGRFGPTNANPMINPQLGNIRELPQICNGHNFNPKATELQNAISSISNETENIHPCFSDEHIRKKPKLTKKRILQNISNASQEFDDDPELSRELAQFSTMLKNQF